MTPLATAVRDTVESLHLFGEIFDQPGCWAMVAGYVFGGDEIEAAVWP